MLIKQAGLKSNLNGMVNGKDLKSCFFFVWLAFLIIYDIQHFFFFFFLFLFCSFKHYRISFCRWCPLAVIMNIKPCVFFCLFSPRTSSQFCRDSARSLVAAYNGGALPCNCDKSGSTGNTCDPAGGQCPCRQHVIGRQCTKCATGYYGFPYCRR